MNSSDVFRATSDEIFLANIHNAVKDRYSTMPQFNIRIIKDNPWHDHSPPRPSLHN